MKKQKSSMKIHILLIVMLFCQALVVAQNNQAVVFETILLDSVENIAVSYANIGIVDKIYWNSFRP